MKTETDNHLDYLPSTPVLRQNDEAIDGHSHHHKEIINTMKIRKITSLTALVSFLLLILNSVVLYIVPQGRLAYWADWHMWGLTKTEWGNQHIIIGVLFLISIFLHIYYNWKPILAYLKNRAKQFKLFTPEFNIALILTILCTVGAYVEVQPFNWVLDFSESIKNSAANNYGEPPYGHAELSTLKTFTSKVGLDLTHSMDLLEKAGVKFESEKQTLLDIAKLNQMTPQQVYLAMKPEEKPSAAKTFPDEPQKGFGKRRLADICQEYGLNISAVLGKLTKDSIAATPDATIKQIAEQNDLTPTEVFTAINKATERHS